ncbi:MAG: exodeoxyribonuclease V subunit gamma, partial [Solirubrobacterales bacterium]|nr:exodeoxyribonuclease V subunit gamma [Solirubrobacterales bacterium]
SREPPAPAHPLESPKHPADTLLAAIQRDVRADRQPPGPPLTDDAEDERMTPAADDQSLRIHACHGRARQVEVLREAILHRLQADPSLEPRDVIVMCPDIEEFAPLIQATFADGLLPLSLADRSPRQTNPLLAVAARLMELAGGRLTVSEVLDLIDMTAVRLRFGFSDDDLTQIRGWANDAQIHWGIDDQHRSRWKLEGIPAGTWRQGLSRLLLATALPAGGTELYGGTLGAADIDSSDIELAGSLAELVDRLDAAVSRLTAPAPLAEWIGALGDAVDSLAAAQAEQAWQRAELGRLLDDLLSDAGLASDVELTLADVRTLLTHALAGRPTRANFRSGRLTVCTMHPMRSIPHRVICLLGMDDHAYPRRSPQDGDDALMEDPHVGDRDPRAEDRQLLLDALMAAEDALIITYSGNDERTNAPLPPAVPIGELLDAVDATAIDARTQVLVRHPLQPFDPKNFSAGALTPDGSWSFDPLALTGAKALLNAERTPAEQKFLPEPLLPPAPEASIALEDLIGFVERPARAFLRQRLGVSVARWEDEVQDELPVEFDALERYGVGQRLLEAVLAGVDWAGAIKAEIARGTLPPGELGRPIVKQASGVVAALADRAKAVGGGDQQTFETNVQLPDGRRVTGTVSGVRDRVLLSVSFARLNPRHRLAAWVRLLALSAAHPDTPWEAITIGKGSGPANTVALARISSLGASTEARAKTAISELTALVDLRAEGLCRPLAIPAKSAEAWVRADAEGEDRVQAALNEWKSGYTRGKNSFYMEREDAEPEHALVFGPELPMAQLEADAPRLWTPLRARERIEYS